MLTITTPPLAVFCVMGATNVAPKTYMLLNPPVRLSCCMWQKHICAWLLTASALLRRKPRIASMCVKNRRQYG